MEPADSSALGINIFTKLSIPLHITRRRRRASRTVVSRGVWSIEPVVTLPKAVMQKRNMSPREVPAAPEGELQAWLLGASSPIPRELVGFFLLC